MNSIYIDGESQITVSIIMFNVSCSFSLPPLYLALSDAYFPHHNKTFFNVARYIRFRTTYTYLESILKQILSTPVQIALSTLKLHNTSVKKKFLKNLNVFPYPNNYNNIYVEEKSSNQGQSLVIVL